MVSLTWIMAKVSVITMGTASQFSQGGSIADRRPQLLQPGIHPCVHPEATFPAVCLANDCSTEQLHRPIPGSLGSRAPPTGLAKLSQNCMAVPLFHPTLLCCSFSPSPGPDLRSSLKTVRAFSGTFSVSPHRCSSAPVTQHVLPQRGFSEDPDQHRLLTGLPAATAPLPQALSRAAGGDHNKTKLLSLACERSGPEFTVGLISWLTLLRPHKSPGYFLTH